MSAAGAFGVVGVDRAAVHGGDRVLDVSAFVERVGVDGHLHVETVGDTQRGADRSGGRTPVLVNFQAAGSGLDLLFERLVHRTVALAQQTDVHRKPLDCLQHTFDVPAAGSDGGAVAAVRGADSAAEQRRNAVAQTGVSLLRGDHVHVAVDAGRRQDQVLARYCVGRGAGHQIGMHAVHDIGISRLADTGDFPVLDTHVGLHDAQIGVDDRHVGDHEVERPFLRSHRIGQPHTVADGFAAAVDDLVAVFAQVFFDLDVKIGVAQPDFVADGGTEQVIVFLT